MVPFDAVVMLDCIEHVSHPDDVVARIAGMSYNLGEYS